MRTSETMQNVIATLAKKHGLDLTRHGNHIRLDMPHYDRLVVEVLHEHLVSVAHIFEPQPGVLLADPGVVFFTGYTLWVPVEIKQRIGGYLIYAVLSDELDEIVSVVPHAQADLADFVEMWAANIVEQGWLEEGILFSEPPAQKEVE